MQGLFRNSTSFILSELDLAKVFDKFPQQFISRSINLKNLLYHRTDFSNYCFTYESVRLL